MTFKTKARWKLFVGCMCAFTSLAIFGSNVSQETAPIGVQIELAPDVQKTWGDAAKQDIPAYALAEFLTRVNEQLAHWDFMPQNSVHSNVTMTLAARKTPRDEIFLQIRLDVPGYESEVLAEELWLDSASLSFALPPDFMAKDAIRDFIDGVFPEHGASKTVSFDFVRFCELAPLASDPKWLSPIDKTFVLPLSKARFSQLRWSVFRLHSNQGHPRTRDLVAEAANEWVKYSDTLTEALKVKTQDLTDKHPNNYTPVRVFLKEYVPDEDVAWDAK